jgi:hypothetical protein
MLSLTAVLAVYPIRFVFLTVYPYECQNLAVDGVFTLNRRRVSDETPRSAARAEMDFSLPHARRTTSVRNSGG